MGTSMKKIVAILFMLLYSMALGQTYEPAISEASFLRMKPQLNGNEPSISDNELDLVFAPSGDFEAQVIYRNGEQIIQQFTAKPSQRSGSMARLKWNRKTVALGTESGPRSIEVVLDGKSVGLLEFSLTKTQGGDPFDPKVSWQMKGPWSDLAYFTHPVDENRQQRINFHFWSQKADLGGNKGMIDVLMKRGSKILAKTRSSEASYDFYLNRDLPLLKPDGKPLMVSDLAAMGGPFVMEMSHKGKVVKKFRGAIADGKFVPNSRSALDYQPRNQFLSPRTVGAKGGQLDEKLYIWLTRE